MDYRVFKNEISNLKAYYRSKKEIENELEVMWHELSGLKAIRYDKQPSSFNPELSESYRLELIDRIEKKQKELDYTILAIERYESELNRLPSDIREMVEQIFILGKTFAEVGKTIGYSDNGLHYKIKKEVEKI